MLEIKKDIKIVARLWGKAGPKGIRPKDKGPKEEVPIQRWGP